MEVIQKAVNAKVNEMVESGEIAKLVEAKVESTISGAISEQFSYGGNLKKQIDNAVEQGLKFDLTAIDFDSYNQQMLSAIKVRLGNMFHGQAYEHFISQIDELLQPAPEEISMDDLLLKIASFWRTDDPFYDDELDSEMTVEIGANEYSSFKSWSINIWKKKEDIGSYRSIANESDIRLHIIDEELRISHRQRYNPTCFDEAEAFIFKLYAAGTKITGIEECNPDMLELYLKEWED